MLQCIYYIPLVLWTSGGVRHYEPQLPTVTQGQMGRLLLEGEGHGEAGKDEDHDDDDDDDEDDEDDDESEGEDENEDDGEGKNGEGEGHQQAPCTHWRIIEDPGRDQFLRTIYTWLEKVELDGPCNGQTGEASFE